MLFVDTNISFHLSFGTWDELSIRVLKLYEIGEKYLFLAEKQSLFLNIFTPIYS